MIASRKRVAAVGAEADLLLDGVEQVVDREAVALHPDGIDHRVRADAAGHFHQGFQDARLLVVDDLGSEPAGEFQAARIMVDGDDAGADDPRALHREEPDRTAAPDRDRVALLDLGIHRRHPAGGQDVGEKSTCSSSRPSGITIGPTSEKGTRTYSACPPG